MKLLTGVSNLEHFLTSLIVTVVLQIYLHKRFVFLVEGFLALFSVSIFEQHLAHPKLVKNSQLLFIHLFQSK